MVCADDPLPGRYWWRGTIPLAPRVPVRARHAQLHHVAHQRQRHVDREDGALLSVRARVQIPQKRQAVPRAPRHRAAQVPHNRVCERLFLAHARGVRVVPYAEVECGVLGGEAHAQPRPRPPAARAAAADGMARDRRVGMRAARRRTRSAARATCGADCGRGVDLWGLRAGANI